MANLLVRSDKQEEALRMSTELAASSRRHQKKSRSWARRKRLSSG